MHIQLKVEIVLEKKVWGVEKPTGNSILQLPGPRTSYQLLYLLIILKPRTIY
jgi:hypothetical protein